MKFHGDVGFWKEDTGVGFIRYGFDQKSILFRITGVDRDWKGSRGWAKVVGTPVTFEIGEHRRSRGDLQKIAINIGPLFLEEAQDLRALRETSLVLRVNRDYGFLKRPCGDELFFHISDVIPGFESRWDDIKAGNVPIFHGVGFDSSTGKWRATCIELFSPEEIAEWRNPLPLEPEPESAPAIATRSELLQPEFRKKTLLEIIAAKRRSK